MSIRYKSSPSFDTSPPQTPDSNLNHPVTPSIPPRAVPRSLNNSIPYTPGLPRQVLDMFGLYVLCLSFVFNIVQHVLNPEFIPAFWTHHIALLDDAILHSRFSALAESLGFFAPIPTIPQYRTANMFTDVEIPIAFVEPPALVLSCIQDPLGLLGATQCFDELDQHPPIQNHVASVSHAPAVTAVVLVDDGPTYTTDLILVSPSNAALWSQDTYMPYQAHYQIVFVVYLVIGLVVIMTSAGYLASSSWVEYLVSLLLLRIILWLRMACRSLGIHNRLYLRLHGRSRIHSPPTLENSSAAPT